MREITKDATYYQQCSAKRGFGPRKRELVQELYSVQNLLTHYTIMGSASRYPESEFAKNAVANQRETETRIKVIKNELDQIVGPWRPRD